MGADEKNENMTLREVAEFFRISYKQASEQYLFWGDQYGIKAFRIGRQILFPTHQVYAARNNAAIV